MHSTNSDIYYLYTLFLTPHVSFEGLDSNLEMPFHKILYPQQKKNSCTVLSVFIQKLAKYQIILHSSQENVCSIRLMCDDIPKIWHLGASHSIPIKS
jgi:hypothetical protein